MPPGSGWVVPGSDSSARHCHDACFLLTAFVSVLGLHLPVSLCSPTRVDGVFVHAIRIQRTLGGVHVALVPGSVAESAHPGSAARESDGGHSSRADRHGHWHHDGAGAVSGPLPWQGPVAEFSLHPADHAVARHWHCPAALFRGHRPAARGTDDFVGACRLHYSAYYTGHPGAHAAP